MDTTLIILGWFLPPILLLSGITYHAYNKAKRKKGDFTIPYSAIPSGLLMIVGGPLSVFFMMVCGLIALKESYEDMIVISFKEETQPKPTKVPTPPTPTPKPKKPRKPRKSVKKPLPQQTEQEAEICSKILN